MTPPQVRRFSANFITGVIQPEGLLLSDNTLYVANDIANGGYVGTYNATTGSAFTTPYSPLISGLQYPFGLPISGNNLYVSQDYSATDWVGEYNASTGATISAQLFTANPAGAYGLALSGNDLFVAGYQNGRWHVINSPCCRTRLRWCPVKASEAL